MDDVIGLARVHSPYLASLIEREPETLDAIRIHGPDAAADRALSLLAGLPPDLPREDLARTLRAQKRRIALATSLADLAGHWPLEAVTGTLSQLADQALRLATAHLLRAHHARGDLVLPHPEAPESGSGFVVLALGKLGARELNFSSDIDLVLLWDSAQHAYTASRGQTTFSRIARALATLLAHHDAEGYVFRTDYRLRPDPAATPPAVSLDTALTYYESQAVTWERAALIKARPVAGDLALGGRFLAAIRPFIWRRHLDFAAIADLQRMKARVDARRQPLPPAGPPEQRVLGFDVKLGEGGIREVEFFAQTLQLVWGGHNPALRCPATLAALAAERDAGLADAEAAQSLATAYRYFRAVEHRLQMVDDHQTHSLPGDAAGLVRFAEFFGAGSARDLAETLLAHASRVHALFRSLAPGASPRAPAIPATFARPAEARATLAAWAEGQPRALRSERARALAADLAAPLLDALGAMPDPDQALARLDDFFERLPAGVQILSQLLHNPALLERLALVFGAAPSLAEHLAATPASLEGLVQADALPAPPLEDATSLEEAILLLTRHVRGADFATAVGELAGTIDVDVGAHRRSGEAERAIAALLPRILEAHNARSGTLPGAELAVVALGKLGSREMMAGSDLDLLLLTEHPPEVLESTGPRRLSAGVWFARLAQGIIAALTSPTRDGPLFAVDMRLRPSGRKGPVAVSLSAFARYHAEDAWTWEGLALTRARVVASTSDAFAARAEAAIGAALIAAARRDTVLADAAAMRARLARDLPDSGPWDIKLRRGGLIELEFLVQALLLAHRLRGASPATADGIRVLNAAGLLNREESDMLLATDRTLRTVQNLLRITAGRVIPRESPSALRPRLAVLLSAEPDEAALRTALDTLCRRVHELFRTRIAASEESSPQ